MAGSHSFLEAPDQHRPEEGIRCQVSVDWPALGEEAVRKRSGMCELPRRIEDHFEHGVAGPPPESERGEHHGNDFPPPLSISKGACGAVPQQQECDSWGNAEKEPEEKSAGFQDVP